MRISVVCGLGIVGSATLAGMRSKGFNNFYGIDKKDEKDWNIPDDWKFIEKDFDAKTQLTNKDIIWICTREENIKSVIEEYKDYTKNFVIRSTVPPELFDLPEKYPELNILHNPEFLRQDYALKDFLNPDRIILGGNCPELKIYIKNLYKEAFPLTKIISDLTFKESCLIKLLNNSYLSTLISFWNEAGKICDKFKVNSERVASVCATDSRISEYGTTSGAKFGGKCLPKDLNYLISLSDKIDLPLLKAVKEVNSSIPK